MSLPLYFILASRSISFRDAYAFSCHDTCFIYTNTQRPARNATVMFGNEAWRDALSSHCHHVTTRSHYDSKRLKQSTTNCNLNNQLK